MKWKHIFNIASLGFLSSVIIDSYLWFKIGYKIPSWTIAVTSGFIIILLQVLGRYMNS